MPTQLSRLIDRYPALAVCHDDLQRAYDLLANAFRNDKKLLLCGNGGSAADSEHWVWELLKGFADPRPLPSHMRKDLTEENGLHAAVGFPGDSTDGLRGVQYCV